MWGVRFTPDSHRPEAEAMDLDIARILNEPDL
jgi:hypothetical protein